MTVQGACLCCFPCCPSLSVLSWLNSAGRARFPSPEGKQHRGCEIRAGVETSVETSSVVQRLGEVLRAGGLWVEEPRIIVILAFPLRGQVPKSL